MGKHVFTLDKIESQYFETSSGELIHFKKHKGNTPWVVFVHGAGSNHTIWKPYLTEDFSWLVFDLPSHGKSSRTTAHLGDILKVMKEIIDTETEGKIVLFGNSFGTFLAEKYYYRYPEDIAQLILAGPYSKNFSYFSSFISGLSRLIVSSFRGKPSKRKLYFIDYFEEGKKPIFYYPYLDLRGTSVSNILNSLAMLFAGNIDFQNIKVPTTVLVGKHDFFCRRGKIKEAGDTNDLINLHFLGTHHLIVTHNYEEIIPLMKERIQ